jgi:hydrogenase nickel incorporation protein HypB
MADPYSIFGRRPDADGAAAREDTAVAARGAVPPGHPEDVMRTAALNHHPSAPGEHRRLNRAALRSAGVYTISVIGGPGCGKTTLIDSTTARLAADVHVGVVTCDPVSNRDADRTGRRSRQVVQVTTGEGYALDAGHVREAIAGLDLDWIDLLFVENVGSPTAAALNDIGQDVTVAIFSVAAGDDQAAKLPGLVRAADVVLLNKVDLLGCVPFDLARFRADVRRGNERADVIEMSGLHAQGAERWLEWLRDRLKKTHEAEASHWFG